ncbi:MAG: hypothetical protein RH981_18950 [Arenibacter sp.]
MAENKRKGKGLIFGLLGLLVAVAVAFWLICKKKCPCKNSSISGESNNDLNTPIFQVDNSGIVDELQQIKDALINKGSDKCGC